MKFSLLLLLFLGVSGVAAGQTPARPRPASTPAVVPAKPAVDKGTVAGRTYTNKTFAFEITLPDSWLIPGDDFEAYMKERGFDLALKAPNSLAPPSRTKINRALQKVAVLLTAYRSMPGTADNSILRISVEDLSAHPEIKDAVDYFDAMRSTFASMRLPVDFRYSDTNAEKLGRQQFGFLDTSNKEGKKRMYATVRSGFAVMFTLTYTKDEDLQTLRKVLEEGEFAPKN